jgi:hypothetical protein
MYSPTYSELKTYLEQELDLQDETFITPNELMSYFNEAVDMIESQIHTIYEDYFLTLTPLTLVNGTSTYSLPTDIYAQKIRKMLYNNGTNLKYEIRRIKKLEETMYVQAPDLYSYLILNTSASGLQINMYPTPQEDTTYIQLWYIRNAKRFTQDTDVCDIPEFTNVLVQFVRWKCLNKEGHPDTQQAAADLDRMRSEMVETLTARIPDEDNWVLKDMSFYRDYDDWRFGGGYY